MKMEICDHKLLINNNEINIIRIMLISNENINKAVVHIRFRHYATPIVTDKSLSAYSIFVLHTPVKT